jgi:hypothetical protein
MAITKSSTKADQGVAKANRQVADREKNLVHARLVADSGARSNEEGTFMVNSRLIFVVSKV